MVTGGLRLAAIGALLSSAATYLSDTLKWRAAHEAELRTPEGWLSTTVYRTATGRDIEMKPDTSGAANVVTSGVSR